MLPSEVIRNTIWILLWQFCLLVPSGMAGKRPVKRKTFTTTKAAAASTTTHSLANSSPKVTSTVKTTTAEPDMQKEIEAALIKEKLIGSRLVTRAPHHLVEISYKSKPVHLGTVFDSDDVIDEPIHVSWPYEDNTYYTFMVIGPDVPSMENPDPEFLSSWEHWMIGNIPKNNLSAGDVLSEYVGISGPEYEIGTHRLVFLVFKQKPVKQFTMEGMTINQTIMFEEGILKKEVIGMMRAHFYPKRISRKYNMVLDPIAVNYCVVHQRKAVFVQPTLPPDETETPEDSEEQEELEKAKAAGKTIKFTTTTEAVGSIVLDKSKVWI